MPLLVLLLLLLTLRPAMAQTVSVVAGEHDGFTRLVLTLPGDADWRLGRTPDGYEFRVPGAQPRYDLSRVFDRINRNRLVSIWADPADGGLRLGVGCPCHALPFEFRPGTIVIDLRDGQPPVGSSFEQSLTGQDLPALAATVAPRPRPRASETQPLFDWRDAALGGRWSGQIPQDRPEPLVPDRHLLTLRDDLLMDFSRAANEGLIDPATRLTRPSTLPLRPAPDRTNLRSGPQLDAHTGLSSAPAIAAQGEVCPPPEALAIMDWGDSRPAAVQMAEAVNDLIGEFDRPDPAAVNRAARFLLFLGFGAETAMLLNTFSSNVPDRQLLLSLARIVDGDPEPTGAFAGLAACDGPAALWAALADPSLSASDINTAALLRSFSLLPPHLRRHLGPDLAERFLAAGDMTTATALHDALLRLPGPPDPRSAVMAARLTSAQGDAPQAAAQLESLLSDPGPTQQQALLALVELHAAEGRPLDPRQADEIAAFLPQAEGSEDAAALARAHVLALALTGRFNEAFSALDTAPDAEADLWRLLSDGPETAILYHAFGAQTEDVPQSSRDAIAARLLDLGFLEEARRWSNLARPEAAAADESFRSALRARNWAALANDSPPTWQQLVAKLSPVAPNPVSPLTHSRALADASANTRAAVEALLTTLPPP